MPTDSVAQTLAYGTQDLAALVGLFCTDGVERNALAVQFGYFTIASSALSLLGVLGLVRSSIKVALGLVRCLNAGFNVDSVRGLFGFLPSEADASSDMIECDFVNIEFAKTPVHDSLSVPPGMSIVSRLKTRIGSWGSVVTGSQDEDYDHLVIRKTRRFFDRRLTPIVGIGNSRTWTEPLQRLSVANLGYLRHEKSWAQSGFLIGFLIVLCSGITCWLLMLTMTRWS
ncbi:hypothetical protein IFR05_015974 [Cadophora sp. M221]|nr:hypothetical protein IFR05_015974 [Cadophora sp. M221]